jgi:hypothetical protein
VAVSFGLKKRLNEKHGWRGFVNSLFIWKVTGVKWLSWLVEGSPLVKGLNSLPP